MVRDGGGNSCEISIKRNFNINNNESHKAQLIEVYWKKEFRSIYDKTNALGFTKVRCVTKGDFEYIDVFYALEETNLCTISIMDAVNCAGGLWSMFEGYTVPETAEGETVWAIMDFGINTWMGKPL